jgi:hypothetical protein
MPKPADPQPSEWGDEARRIFSASIHESRKLTPRAQAEAAHRAGGPSVDELEARIIAKRAQPDHGW